jgi:cytochrome P450
MESLTIQGYRDAFRTLTHRDLAQSLYDEGGIIMKEVILTLEGEDHAQRRKAEFHVFRKEISRHYEAVEFPNILNPILDEVEAAGSADLVELGYRVTMNVTADVAGIDRPENTAKETQHLLEMVKVFSEGATLVHSLKDKEAVRQQVLEVLEVFDADFLQASIARRQGLLEQHRRGEIAAEALPNDILMTLMRHQERLQLSHELLRREIAFYLQAGSHSTANASTHAFHELWEWMQSHPEDEASLREDLFFIQRCVFETLRLHPASPVAWRKARCPAHLPDGRQAEEGDRVVIDLWSANRDSEIYGAEAERYNPHRTFPDKQPPWGLTFGIGQHACLGKVLDGGEIPGPDTVPEEHNFGLIAHFMKGLLDRGACPDPDAPPQRDSNTERPNWGRYPLCVRTGFPFSRE